MTETASLQVKVDTSEVRRATDDLKDLADDAAPKAAKATDDYAKKAREAEQSVGVFGKGVDALKGQLAGLVAGLSVGAFTMWIKGAIDAADAASESAQAAGLATNEYLKLQAAIQVSGAENANITTSMVQLNQKIAENAAALSNLGVATRDAAGNTRSAYDVMLDLSDVFQRMPDGAEKAALAAELFGARSGPALVPMLNQGRDAILEIGSSVATVSQQFEDEAGRLEKNTMALGGLFNSLRNNIAEAVLPALNSVIEWAVKFGPALTPVLQVVGTLAGAVGGVLLFAFKSLATTLSIVMGAFTAVGQSIATVAAAAVKVAQGDFSGAWEAIKAGGSSVVDTARNTTDQLIALWGEQEKAAQTHATNMTTATAPVVSAVAAPAVAATATGAAKTAGDKKAAVDPFSGLVMEDFDAALADARGRLEAEMALRQAVTDQYYASQVKAEEEFSARTALEQARRSDFVMKGLDSLAKGRSKASKAARNLQKADALYQIGVDTKAAAIGAYKALAGIPIVGPGLGAAAAAAAIAFGGSMARDVMSGGSSGGGSVPAAASGRGAVSGGASLSQNDVPARQAAGQNIQIRLTGEGLLSTQQVAALFEQFGERLSDSGGRIGKVQVVTV